jgi:hypothetical protein
MSKNKNNRVAITSKGLINEISYLFPFCPHIIEWKSCFIHLSQKCRDTQQVSYFIEKSQRYEQILAKNVNSQTPEEMFIFTQNRRNASEIQCEILFSYVRLAKSWWLKAHFRAVPYMAVDNIKAAPVKG